MGIRPVVLLTLCALCAFPSVAESSELIETKDSVVKDPPPEDKQGWDPFINIGATVAFGSNSDVVGQPDGASWTFGMLLKSAADFLSGKNDWRNSLTLNEVVTRTPVVDAWVKTIDELKIISTYYFRALPNFGPYVNANFTTSIFAGTDVRAAPVDYVDVNDPTIIFASNSQGLRLTDPLSPALLKESVGAFWTVIDTHPFAMQTRLGFGASHSFAKGALVVTDDDATPNIVEVTTLSNTHQGGLVIGAGFKGAITDQRVEGDEIVDKDIILYEAFAEVMIPFINNEPAGGRTLGQLTNYEAGVKVGFKIVSWASLEYEFKGLKKPDMIDAWQLTHTLLLNFNYDVIE